MATTARGCQTVTAEENALRRRSAKARQNAARKARADAEKKAQENYTLGFDFVSSESRKEQKYKEKMKPIWDAQNQLVKESDVLFRGWIRQLQDGKLVRLEMNVEDNKVYIFARSRLLDVVEAFPEKYSQTYYEEYILVAVPRAA